MFKVTRQGVTASFLASALLFGLGKASAGMLASASAATPLPVVAIPGYNVSVFAKGTAAYMNPDSIVSDGQQVWVGYQNVTAKDGSDHKASTIVEYSPMGQVLHTYSAPGHNDGLRIDPASHLVWALCDEDGNPMLTTIDPTSGKTTLYHFPATKHGGGYDDIAFTNGMALIDASNPNLDKNGNNGFPALYKAVLGSGMVSVTPVLMGNPTAIDLTTNKKVTLNLIDPDSMTFDPQSNLVLDNQGGADLEFIAHVGTPQQSISRLPVGTQVDDTIWTSSTQGRLLVSDTSANTIYAIHTTFAPGSIYAAAPADSGVAGFVGALDAKTGIITPIAVGLKSPHGMVFLAGTQQ